MKKEKWCLDDDDDITLHYFLQLASTVWESLNRPPHNPYATNWLERLRKIRKIKQMVLPEGDGRPPSSDFTDMVDWLDRERGRGGTGYWQQVFL